MYKHSGLLKLAEALNDTGGVYELGDGSSETLPATKLATKIGNSTGESASLLALGDLERRRKRNQAAVSYFERAMERAEATGDEGSTTAALNQIARPQL